MKLSNGNSYLCVGMWGASSALGVDGAPQHSSTLHLAIYNVWVEKLFVQVFHISSYFYSSSVFLPVLFWRTVTFNSLSATEAKGFLALKEIIYDPYKEIILKKKKCILICTFERFLLSVCMNLR